MSLSIVFFIATAILLYGGINYYIGSHFYMYLNKLPYEINPRIYWSFFWVAALSYIIFQLAGRFLPGKIETAIGTISNYWLAVIFYSSIIFILLDILRLTDRWIGIVPSSFRENQSYINSFVGVIFILIAGVLIYGSYNAKSPFVRKYDIKINKSANGIQSLNAVMVSDIHVGDVVNRKRVEAMAEEINRLKPDIVFISGDIIDHSLEPFVKNNVADVFKTIDSKYGIYACLGNHDYFSGRVDRVVSEFQRGGIKVLRDEYVKLDDSFYIAGREDESSERFLKNGRREIGEILKDADKCLPIILLDHRPVELEKSMLSGVDLQLSGHTHRGQMFPANLITNKIFEVDFGYYLKESLHTIVSSGFGTWGPPLKVGNKSEIVNINIQFENKP